MKILNFGSCNIDYVYSVDHIVAGGETETSEGLNLYPGGKGLNQSLALSRAGAMVYHAGCIGSDGQMLLDVLSESGVDVSLVKQVEEKQGHAIIQVSKEGENAIVLYEGSNGCVTTEYVDEVLELFCQGDIVILQNEISNVDYIIEKAYEKGMCIVLNPSPYNEKLNSIDFRMISYLILNEVEAEGFSGSSDADASLRHFKEHYPHVKVMLTLGSRGCVFQDETGTYRQPACRVDVVDTTAAGDTFTGYFVAEIAKGTAYPKVLELATKAAAIAVSRKGAGPSIPHMEELERYE